MKIKTAECVGGIVHDSTPDSVMTLEGVGAILTNARGYNIAEFRSLCECVGRALEMWPDVIFVARGKHCFDLVRLTDDQVL